MKKNIASAITTFLFFTIFFGMIYPLTMTFISKQTFPKQAAGSLIEMNGEILGSKLIGQNFSDPKYLWGRLSATGPNPYNAAASSGSNLDWSNENFLKNIQGRIDLLQKFDPENKQEIPVDLVTASASGLDPQISVDAASYQVARIAKFRNITEKEVTEIIKKHTSSKQLGLFGENRVNVLEVNLELDGKCCN